MHSELWAGLWPIGGLFELEIRSFKHWVAQRRRGVFSSSQEKDMKKGLRVDLSNLGGGVDHVTVQPTVSQTNHSYADFSTMLKKPPNPRIIYWAMIGENNI